MFNFVSLSSLSWWKSDKNANAIANGPLNIGQIMNTIVRNGASLMTRPAPSENTRQLK